MWHALSGFRADKPVYVESESAKIGALRVPEALLAEMHARGHCVRIHCSDEARIAMLLDDYALSTQDPEPLCSLLGGLVELRGRAVVDEWQSLARAGQWPALIARLMDEHYDPLYDRSMRRSYPRLDTAERITLAGGSAGELAVAVGALQALGKPAQTGPL